MYKAIYELCTLQQMINSSIMEQKLYYLDTCTSRTDCIHSCEIEIPEDLKELMDDGWRITQVSAFGYGGQNVNPQEPCILLLQREKDN